MTKQRVIGYEYLIHDAEAETIRRAFGLYAEGMSTRRIAALLNAEGVPPPGARWKDRQGVRRTWTHGAIYGDPKRGLGILNNERYRGPLIWNRRTWPRDPDRDAKQVRRELPHEQWVVREVPDLRIVPQDLWQAMKTRQRQCSRGGSRSTAHWRNRRLLSGLLVCARWGGHFVLHGANTYTWSTRQNRGAVVCDCMATVNAAEAEDRILAELEHLFCDEELIRRVTEQARRLASERQQGRRQRRDTEKGLRKQLAEAEAEVSRLVTAIAKGALVESLLERMQAAEVRRDHLRQELDAIHKAEALPGMELMPAAVRRLLTGLRRMLAAGQVSQVRSALCRLVTRIEVHEEPRPGRKRPGTCLVLHGNLQAALHLADEKGTSGCSPGGIRTRDLMAENHAS